MPALHRLLATAVAALPALALTAVPTAAHAGTAVGTVYVLGNQASGNAVLSYDRLADGTLEPAGSTPTGGLGTGGGLGSQGALVLDRAGRYLYAVDAGSDTVTSFRVGADGLQRVSHVASGGSRPTSLTVHGGLLYVLDAGGAGSITGFAVHDGALTALPGSSRPLSGSSTGPAQVSFTPDGSHLVVAEKATDVLDVYAVGGDGLAQGPTVAASAGTTPFGFDFDNKGHLIVSEAFGGAPDGSAVSSYRLVGDGLQTVSASVPTTETAACWVATTADGRFAYAGNAGSASVTGYRVAPDGSVAVLDADGRTGTASAGVTDLATSGDSRFLYGRVSDGTVASWAVASSGALTAVGTATGLPAGAAGLAAR